MPTSLPAIVIVTALLGYMASAVQPSFTTAESSRVDAAAQNIAHLLRLAQTEAVRTGATHGVTYDPAQRRLSVVRADASTEPFTVIEVLYHPVHKQPAILTIDSAIELLPDDNLFDFGVQGRRNRLAFDRSGTPVYPTLSGNAQLADSALRVGGAGGYYRTLQLTALNGRVQLL